MDGKTIQQSFLEWGLDYAPRILGAILLLLIAWIIAGWSKGMVQRAMSRAKCDETLTKFLAALSRWGLLLLAVLACLSIFNVETTSFAAVLGAAGLAIGLAFQGTLSNIAAGVMLLVFRPFKVGDAVTAAGQTGKVDTIELFTTTLDTFDNRRLVIPNSSLFGSVIENISHHQVRRADVNVGVDYSADIDKTRQVLMQAVHDIPDVLTDPAPAVLLLELGASSVNWSVRVWAAASQFGDVKQAAIRGVKMALDRAGIGIPYPQLDVHLDQPVKAG